MTGHTRERIHDTFTLANVFGREYVLEHGSVRAAETYRDGAYTGKYKLMNKTRLLWKSRFVYTEEKHRKLADGSVALAGKVWL